MKKICIFLLIIAMCDTVYGQSKNSVNTDFNIVIGKIVNNEDVGVSGIIIKIKGKTTIIVTDATGNFSIYALPKDTILVKGTDSESLSIPLFNSPSSIRLRENRVILVYKNITNVSGEYNSKMSINTFVFPPLNGYSIKVLPDYIFSQSKFLSDVDRKISETLESLGYDEKSYFIIPGGFAIATRIETIDLNGNPIMNGTRFAINEVKSISFIDFIAPQSGYYRIFIFVVTNQSFKPNNLKANFEDISNWSTVGLNVLPDKAKKMSFFKSYKCSVITYEFTSDRPNSVLQIHKPTYSANDHLIRSKILNRISQQ